MGPGMGMGMQMQPQMKQSLILAPRMIQSMEILQLPIMALQERIQQEIQDNPVLEQSELSTDDDSADDNFLNEFAEERKDPSDPSEELVIDTQSDGVEDFDRLEKLNQDWADHFNEEQSRVSSKIQAIDSTVILPASILEKSKTSFKSRRSESPDRWIVLK